GAQPGATQGGTGAASDQSGQAGMSDQNRDQNKQTIRGCLSGTEGSFTLTDMSGTTYRLQGKDDKLKKEVGHEVELKVERSESAMAGGAGTTGQAGGTSGAATTAPSGQTQPSTSGSISGRPGETSATGGAASEQTVKVKDVKKISDTCTTSPSGNPPSGGMASSQPSETGATAGTTGGVAGTTTAQAGQQPGTTQEQPSTAGQPSAASPSEPSTAGQPSTAAPTETQPSMQGQAAETQPGMQGQSTSGTQATGAAPGQSTSGTQTPGQATSGAQTTTGTSATFRGCVSKSGNDIMLSADNGQKYRLMGDTSKLSEHVGHQVEVTGVPSAGAQASATTSQPGAQTGGGASASASSEQTLEVSDIRHISETCGTTGALGASEYNTGAGAGTAAQPAAEPGMQSRAEAAGTKVEHGAETAAGAVEHGAEAA